MKVSEVFPSKYVRAEDLGGRNVTVVIRHATMEELGKPGEKENKLVVWFEKASKGLVLNKTNAMIIAGLYGDDTDYWRGKAITLYPDRITAFGKTQDVIRVLNKQPQAKTEAPPPPQGEVEPTPQEEMEKWEDTAQLRAVVALSTSDDALFYETEDVTSLRELLQEADAQSQDVMYTKPAEGKKVSMYGFLCAKIEEVTGKGTHGVVLSYLLGRVITKDTPPGLSCRFLLDDLMADGMYKDALSQTYGMLVEQGTVTE